MADFDFDKNAFEDIIDWAIADWAYMTLSLSQERTPRDKERLPNPIVLKTKEKPERNVREWNKKYYRKPVNINWLWYEWVSWALKRSLDVEKLWKWEYIVWIKRWPTEWYWAIQEFWSDDWTIKSRSFLRETLRQDWKKIVNQIQKKFNELSK